MVPNRRFAIVPSFVPTRDHGLRGLCRLRPRLPVARALHGVPDGLRLRVDVAAEFTAAGQSALLDLGGILRSVAFDAQGASATATESVKLKLKKLKTGSNLGAELSLKGKAAALADAFLGLQTAAALEADETALPRMVAVLLGGQVFAATANFTYKRKKGGPGSAGLAR